MAGAESHYGCCVVCRKDIPDKMMIKCGCKKHEGYACYDCLRRIYIKKPKTIFDFPFQCYNADCQRELTGNWVRHFFGACISANIMRKKMAERSYQRYIQMTLLAERYHCSLGPYWKSVFSDPQSVARTFIASRNGNTLDWRLRLRLLAWICDDPARIDIYTFDGQNHYGLNHYYHSIRKGDKFTVCNHCHKRTAGGTDYIECPYCGLLNYMPRKTKTRRNSRRPLLRMETVMQYSTATMLLGEVEIDEEECRDENVKADINEGDGFERNAEVETDFSFCKTDDIDMMLDINYVSCANGSDEEFDQSCSVVPSDEHTRTSCSSFSVVSGIGSVLSLDEFDDVAWLGDCSGTDVVTMEPVSSLVSYCDVVKKSIPCAVLTTYKKMGPPRQNRVVKQSRAAKPLEADKNQGTHVKSDDRDAFASDYNCFKYDGRGGKNSLHYSGGRSTRHHEQINQGRKMTRKERRASKHERKWYDRNGPGKRCDFRSTKREAQKFYGII